MNDVDDADDNADDEEVLLELTHTRYLEEVRSVRSSSAILITTSFSHWI